MKFLVKGWNEWKTAQKEMTVEARSPKEAREQAKQSRSMDGGIISVRIAPKKRRSSDPERGGPDDR